MPESDGSFKLDAALGSAEVERSEVTIERANTAARLIRRRIHIVDDGTDQAHVDALVDKAVAAFKRLDAAVDEIDLPKPEGV